MSAAGLPGADSLRSPDPGCERGEALSHLRSGKEGRGEGVRWEGDAAVVQSGRGGEEGRRGARRLDRERKEGADVAPRKAQRRRLHEVQSAYRARLSDSPPADPEAQRCKQRSLRPEKRCGGAEKHLQFQLRSLPSVRLSIRHLLQRRHDPLRLLGAALRGQWRR